MPDFSNSPALVAVRVAERHRRFLVVIRAGSLPRPSLFRGPLPAVRNYDVAVNYFAVPHPDDIAFTSGEFVFAGGLSKYHAAKRILVESRLLDPYDGVLFLDEDVELHFDLSEFFEFCREKRFSIAQPSLTHHSAGAYRATYYHPGYQFRLTNFVEVMAPFFAREFLQTMVQSFDLSISGWGLDVFWGSQLTERRSAAIIDNFRMTHLRRPDPHHGPYYVYLRSIGVDWRSEFESIFTRLGISEYPIRVKGGSQIVQCVTRQDIGLGESSTASAVSRD